MSLFSKKINTNNQVMQINPHDILPNKDQPRRIFSEEELAELAQSIKTFGIIQPIIVRPLDGKYQIIAGERRWRASISLSLSQVPVIIREYDDLQSSMLAIIENIQREDLTPIEEAKAFKSLIEMYGLTQESLAQRLGKSQSTIGNKLRMLYLPDAVQNAILERKIHDRHARALLQLKSEELQLLLLDEIINNDLNARQTESRVKQLLNVEELPPKRRIYQFTKDYRLALNTIRESFQMVSRNGINLEIKEEENTEEHIFLIKFPKNKKI